jgi:hypothetical protein
VSKKLKLPLLFALAFLLLALRPSPALAIYWSTPEKINTSSNQAILPNIVTGPNGYLHAAWMELIPGDDDFWSGSLTPGIFYSYWNGDAWSSPTKISQHPSTGWTGFPGIAVTSNDYVHIVWEDDTEVIPEVWGRILYRYYDGNSWSSPISISHNTTGSWSYAPKIVKDSADNFHVIYNNEGNGLELYYTNWNGSTWSTPEKLSVTGGYDSLEHSDIAVDSNNYPHVILWEQQQGIYHTNFNGTSWETPTLLTADGGYPQIVIDNNDNRHVIWSLPWYDPQDLAWKNKIEYVRWDGSWSASPTTISTDAAYSPWMLPIIGITFDSDNNVYVGWGERVGWDSIPYKGVEVSYKRWNGSVWSDPFFLRKTYDLDTPFIYQDKWDNQHITWSEENETTGIWEFWYAAIPVNVKDYNPQAAFNLTLNITGDSLSISPNALTEPATISAQIGPVPASADPDVTTIPRSYTYRPHGTTFITGKEAEAKIYYEDSVTMKIQK